MSRLSNFSDAPILVKDELGDVSVKVYPILGKKSYIFDELSIAKTKEEKFDSVKLLIKEALRDEEVTDAELDEMSLRVQNLLMDAIIKVNGYEDKVEDAKRRFITAESRKAQTKG